MQVERRWFVGNIFWGASKDEVRDFLEERLGRHAVSVQGFEPKHDPVTNRFRGFGFVTVSLEDSADEQAILDEVTGTVFHGRGLAINKARPPRETAYSDQAAYQPRHGAQR